jgi:hypothetical protein
MGARDSEAWSRLWLQPDPVIPDLRNPQSLNRSSFVLNNPLQYVDPTGHCPEAIAEHGGDFGCGFLWQFSEDFTLGLGQAPGWDYDYSPTDSSVLDAGRVTGRLGAMAAALGEGFGGGATIASASVGIGAAVICTGATGVCVVVAAPATVAAGAGLTVGAGLIGHGAAVLGRAATAPPSNYDLAKRSKHLGKEAATDVPSWAAGAKRLPGEDGKAAADRLMEERWGSGWRTDPKRVTEHRQIQKKLDRKN